MHNKIIMVINRSVNQSFFRNVSVRLRRKHSFPCKLVNSERHIHSCSYLSAASTSATKSPCLQWPSTSTNLSASDCKSIEAHWQSDVERPLGEQRSAAESIDTDGQRHGHMDSKYILSMFPYPSGKLHMGHVRVYCMSDCFARFYSLKGFKVFQPMGWDSFGLPAENAARAHGQSAKQWTHDNMHVMRKQLHSLGAAFDWSAELSTSCPTYYKWTQWLFTVLHKHGYTNQRHSLVNWDPIDQTVLADEQIDAEGKSWRSGALAEKRLMRQWSVRTTLLAKRMYDKLDDLLEWHDIAVIQRHWIGPCNYYSFHLPVTSVDSTQVLDPLEVRCVDPVQLSEAQFIAVKPTHVLCEMLQTNTGLLRAQAFDPIYNRVLPIVVVDDNSVYATEHLDAAFGGASLSPVFEDYENAFKLDCKKIEIHDTLGAETIIQKAVSLGAGGYETSGRQRDWVVSRQRYWGTPIPIIHCTQCGVGSVPVPEHDLPVLLPELSRLPVGTCGASPLSAIKEWVNTKCPSCGGAAERETDTLDTFFDSSWYFLRYPDARNTQRIFDPAIVNANMPVHLYVGGKEHAMLHLYYARFMTHFLNVIGLLDVSEPFARLVPQGIVRGATFTDTHTGQYYHRDTVLQDGTEWRHQESQQLVTMSYAKMSKSKLNGTDPELVLKEFSTDLVRLLMMSNVSPFSERQWNMDAMKGVRTWLGRVRWAVNEYVKQRTLIMDDKDSGIDRQVVMDEVDTHDTHIRQQYNHCVKHVTHSVQNTQLLNAAISRMHVLTSALRKYPVPSISVSAQYERAVHALVVMLYPFAPSLAAEFWAALCSVPAIDTQSIRHDQPIWAQDWPVMDADEPLELEMTLNGTTVDRVMLMCDVMQTVTQTQALDMAVHSDKVLGVLDGRQIQGALLVDMPGYGKQLIMTAAKLHKSKRKPRGFDKKTEEKE